MKVATAEADVLSSLGFLVQILNPDGSNAKNNITIAELRQLYSGKQQPSKTAKPSKKDKSGCLIAMLLSPFL